MIKHVYIVQHEHEVEGCDDVKLIGIFSSLEKANATVERYKNLPGFRDCKDSFFVNDYILDETEWKEGFVTII